MSDKVPELMTKVAKYEILKPITVIISEGSVPVKLPIMLRWAIYILRRLANLLGDPVDTTMCQVCEGGGRKEGDWCPTCQGKMWIPLVSDPTTSHQSEQ